MFTVTLPMPMCEHIAMGQALTHSRNAFFLLRRNEKEILT